MSTEKKQELDFAPFLQSYKIGSEGLLTIDINPKNYSIIWQRVYHDTTDSVIWNSPITKVEHIQHLKGELESIVEGLDLARQFLTVEGNVQRVHHNEVYIDLGYVDDRARMVVENDLYNLKIEVSSVYSRGTIYEGDPKLRVGFLDSLIEDMNTAIAHVDRVLRLLN